MASKSLSLVFILVSVLSSSIPKAASADAIGIWQQIDPKDPEVAKIANFAVKEHNRQAKTALVFVSVVKAEEQVAGDTNYRLTIAATDGGAARKKYIALVASSNQSEILKLVSFEPIQG